MLTILDILYALDLKANDRKDPSLQEVVTGVSIDSRTLEKGNVFIAIQGNEQDGHIYIKNALAKGASLIILSDTRYCDDCANHSYFIVPDTQKALEKLAMAYRVKLNQDAKVIAITGSVGKTTLKEFLNKVLSPFGSTVASQKSYNNHWGVPLSLCQLKDDTKYAIFEIGMNHIGEIAPLACMVTPDIAIITAIEPAHIGNLGSVEAIANEKSDIFWGLQKGGVAILPSDTPYIDLLRKKAEEKTLDIITVGKAANSSIQLLNTTFDEDGMIIESSIFGKIVSWKMKAFGEHYALLSLFALAAAIKVGYTFEELKPHLESLTPLPRRGQINVLPLKKGGTITVIDDSYNANISSMKAGLSVLERLKGNRKIAVLGQMGELAEMSEQIHADLGQILNQMHLDFVFASGTEMIHTFNQLKNKSNALFGEDVFKLTPKIIETLEPNDILFIKGSKSNKLWTLLDSI